MTGAGDRFRSYLNMLTLAALPTDSTGPQPGDDEAVYAAIRDAGYEGVQGFPVSIAGLPAVDAETCGKYGLACATSGRVDEPGTIDKQTKYWADNGFESATVHVGRGHEDDALARALVDEILTASERHGFPLFVETHRGTVTQDTWRTVQLVEEFPDLRFTGDFSHWYTGLEMTYGDFDERIAFIEPVFERTRFLHGRIGDPGCIQIDVGDGDPATHPSVAHFETFWTAAFRGFLGHADPAEQVVFAPELLPAAINYARTVPGPDGDRVEEGDRWQQAQVLTAIARRCYDRASRAVP
jgi:hypothetical protein